MIASNAAALFPSARIPSLEGERNKAAALEATLLKTSGIDTESDRTQNIAQNWY